MAEPLLAGGDRHPYSDEKGEFPRAGPSSPSSSLPARRLDDDEIVHAVLDLYKRSLRPVHDGHGDVGLSFAGSFASLSGPPPDTDPDAPALLLSCQPPSLGDEILRGVGRSAVSFSPGCSLAMATISFAELPALAARLAENRLAAGRHAAEGVVWLHSVGGNEAVAAIGHSLGMHPVARRLFGDTSPQSVVNHLGADGELAVTSVSVCAAGALLRAHKLTLWARPGVLLTSERELLSPRGEPAWGGRQVYDRVVALLPGAVRALGDLGGGFLVYLLLTEMTREVGSVLDLYARCLAHLQRAVDMRRVTHKRRIKVLRDLHNLQSGLVVLKAFCSNTTALRLRRGLNGAPSLSVGAVGTADASAAADQASAGEKGGSVLVDAHMPYLRDLHESVKWVTRTVEAHESAIQEVRENLTVVSELRVQQVNTTLSLVATIFLPLTFLTGVFGMNFTYDDKFPIGLEMLNWHYGAIYFWLICVVFVAGSFWIFRVYGWSETLRHDQLAWG